MSQSTSAAAGNGAQISQGSQLWTRAFILLCVNTVLCYCCHQLLVVVLPLYVQSMGGSPFFAGLIFAAFSVISFILRPLLGHLTDRWSVRGTLLIGASFLGVFGALFAVPSISGSVHRQLIPGHRLGRIQHGKLGGCGAGESAGPTG